MLTRLRIENFRCFDEVELFPADLTLLIGRNGSGKSTVLDVLASLREIVVLGKPVEEVLWGSARTEGGTVFEIELSLGGRELAYRLEIDDSTDDWLIHHEHVVEATEAGPRAWFTADGGHVELDGAALGARWKTDASPLASFSFDADHPCALLRTWLEGVWLLRLNPQGMDGAAAEADEQLESSGENFGEWLLSFDQAELDGLATHLGNTIDRLTRIQFVEAGRKSVLVAGFSDDRDLDFEDLSDGQRVLIVLHAVLLLVGDATLLLLDEPDAHVTSTEILPLVRRIRNGAESGDYQAIVVSHHPQMLDLLASDHVVEIDASAGPDSARPLQFDTEDPIPASRYILLRGA